MFSGKKIILGISGSIAAYKSILLLRLLVKQGAEVQVMMTPSAASFVSPLVLATLSGRPVVMQLSENDQWENHVALGRWADLMIMAPLSCNTLAKMANGICDNLFLAVYLSATCPVMLAPAMDEDMWKHFATQRNLDVLLARGHRLIPVENGELASGLIGEGRMAEPEKILQQAHDFFSLHAALQGKKILITAGPTYEPIDPVRFVGNHSSGKMGYALAEACSSAGGEVTLITGPTGLKTPVNLHHVMHVDTASDMYNAVMDREHSADIIIMSAAVADYAPVDVHSQKIKKQSDTITITLQRTQDILKALGEKKKPHQLLIGFALETENGPAYAEKKLNEKKADIIILNQYKPGTSGFGSETNQIIVFRKNKPALQFPLKSKQAVATDIVQVIKSMLHA
ncbi:MAG: bifunctional phosphopantothenoylcysteine decarboxylase/phosphopantothenate--cysteine ligase CoaBC [Bacteroidota bacterium]